MSSGTVEFHRKRGRIRCPFFVYALDSIALSTGVDKMAENRYNRASRRSDTSGFQRCRPCRQRRGLAERNVRQMRNVIEIQNLCKTFGDIRAVQDVSFYVREGELFAFLGVNGAGKSTTISILCGQLAQDSGTILINGKQMNRGAAELKRDIGVVFQNSVLDQALSVQDNLAARAACYGISGKRFQTRLTELSALLELEPLLRRPLGRLSGGQKRRIDIARALLHRPGILILDEPTTGLDPQTRKHIWDVVEQLRRQEGMTVLLTTHYMEEAADADDVVIIDGGRISAKGTPLELKNQYTGDYITLYGVEEEQVKRLGVSYESVRGAYRITVPDTAAATALIVGNRELFRDYEVIKGKMDDVFLAVTGKKLIGGQDK